MVGAVSSIEHESRRGAISGRDGYALVTGDGGLCLPYQEIPFPYSISTDPNADPVSYVDTATAAIMCPGPNWNPDTAFCYDDAGEITGCKYAAYNSTDDPASGERSAAPNKNKAPTRPL